jgi:hypothetical protein
MKYITTCECPVCETNPPEPCREDAQVMGVTDDGAKALCECCAVNHVDACFVMQIDNMTDEYLEEEWGRKVA